MGHIFLGFKSKNEKLHAYLIIIIIIIINNNNNNENNSFFIIIINNSLSIHPSSYLFIHFQLNVCIFRAEKLFRGPFQKGG